MDKITSAFKIGKSSTPEIFSGDESSSPSSSKNVYMIIGVVVILGALYFYRSTLLQFYNSGLMTQLSSALYLTSKGEVHTTQLPEGSSIANVLSEMAV
jgi:hypothetical protein